MDPNVLSSVARLSNTELVARVKHLAQRKREVTASLIAHLAELDERRLYLAEGCPSLFTYCTQVLHLSEHAAYGRIEAARAVRQFPVLLERLSEGSVTLTTVGLLASHLTPENHRDLLDMARHQSKRQVEALVARLRPQPSVPSSVRRLPTASHPTAQPTAPAEAAASPQPAGEGHGVTSVGLPAPAITPPPARPAVVAPLAPERYKVQFTASAETCEKLRLAQALLRHQIPDGDLGTIVDRALTALLRDVTKQRFAATDRPRRGRGPAPGSRHIPAEVTRAVWLRDGGRCAFVSSTGRRCTEQGFLECHHVTPYAAGGASTADNLQLRCRAHNGYEAERYFGRRTCSGVRDARAAPTPSPAEPPPPPSRLDLCSHGARTECGPGPLEQP
jgi:5-methylcytosine-specific restriction endonuclease McrA